MRESSGVWKFSSWLALAIVFAVAGCRTIPPMPAANLSQPGWKLRQGQAIWKTSADAPEIAGELLFAENSDGRTVLQFSKNPIPFVNVQTSNELWQIEFVPQKRNFSGRGEPTRRLVWVHLARAFQGGKTMRAFQFTPGTGGDFTFENRSTGELISGFLQ